LKLNVICSINKKIFCTIVVVDIIIQQDLCFVVVVVVVAGELRVNERNKF